MEYNASDSSGTDDDLPPSHQNRNPRGSRVTGNERSAIGSVPYPRMYADMEAEIHHLEQEAYCAILRAFKAQSDALTWEKEGLITELRKELRVSDDEHRELLTQVNAEEIITKIREWRKMGSSQGPAVLSSRKKQRTTQPDHQYVSSMRSMQSPAGPVPSRPFMSRSNSVARPTSDHTGTGNYDSLVGRKLWTRWPEDNSFYEAVISDYNPAEGRHALIYDIHTANETWEWVNLKEIPPEDIRWEGDDVGISHGVATHVGGPGRGPKRPTNRGGVGPGAGRGRPVKNQPRKDVPPSQNGAASQKVSDDIELLNTDALVKEVETVFNVNHPDPFELEKAKKMLKEHEQALIEAIQKLSYASDNESDGEHQFHYGQSVERE